MSGREEYIALPSRDLDEYILLEDLPFDERHAPATYKTCYQTGIVVALYRTHRTERCGFNNLLI